MTHCAPSSPAFGRDVHAFNDVELLVHDRLVLFGKEIGSCFAVVGGELALCKQNARVNRRSRLQFAPRAE